MVPSRIIFHLLLCLVLAAPASLTGCTDTEAQADTAPSSSDPAATSPHGGVAGAYAGDTLVIPVGVERVSPTPIRDILALPGEAEALAEVLVSAERAGRVEWIGPTEGQRVRKGDPIAKIDLKALEAALKRATASYTLAEQQARRRQELYDLKVLSLEELDNALTQQTLAKANLEEARVNYEQGIVRAPMDGVINSLDIDPGEYVDRGTLVAELVDHSMIRMLFDVPEMDVRYFKVGQSVPVILDALPGAAWIGQVDYVAYKADSDTKTFRVRVVVVNDEGNIRSGMIGRAQFLRQEIQDAVSAPLFAVVDRGGEYVLYVEENGVARSRTVELGVIDEERVQVLSGLGVGENLIVKGHTDVEDGMKVALR